MDGQGSGEMTLDLGAGEPWEIQECKQQVQACMFLQQSFSLNLGGKLKRA